MENDDHLPGSEQPNRREFLLTAGSTVAAGVIAAYSPAHAATDEAAAYASVAQMQKASSLLAVFYAIITSS